MVFQWAFALTCLVLSLDAYVLSGKQNAAITDEQPLTTTIGNLPCVPCAGRLVVVLDTSKALSSEQFKNQQDFIGQKLFLSPNFNRFERLSLSNYGTFGAEIAVFGSFTSPEDVSEYASQLQHSANRNGNLRRALSSFVDMDLNDEEIQSTTVVILVSHISEKEVNDCRNLAIQLQKQQIRLVLIAHGNSVDSSLLAQITGDSQLVMEWKADAKEPENNQKWLSQFLNCPAQSV